MSFFAKYKYFVILLVLSCVVAVSSFYYVLKPRPRLPVFQPSDVTRTLMDSSIWHVKKYHVIPEFKLVNQNGDTISQKNYENKIYVADFFFTTCPGICLVMTKNMKAIQEAFFKDAEVMLLSHTVTPEIDSVPVLKKYALEKGVKDEKWNLVTGSRNQIYDLARKAYLVAKLDGDNDKMIHTENFVLVDKSKRIRGFYDGTQPQDIEKLIHDIAVLKNEY